MLAVAAGIGVLARADRIPAVQPTPTQPYEDLGIFGPASLNEMTDFDERPEFGLGIWDRRSEYGYGSGALGLVGVADEGYRTAALCFQDPGIVVVVLANAEEHEVDTVAGNLVDAATT